MITKITKINNLGIFRDYSVDDGPPWGDPLHEFKKYNIIFGTNGTGKTTLSKLFEKISQSNKAEVSGIDKLEYEEDDYSEADYKIKYNHDNKNYSSSDNHPFKVKVFNRDYIDKNIKFYAGEATPILLVSEEAIKSEGEVKKQEEKSQRIKSIIKSLDKIITGWSKKEDQLFKDAAVNIKLGVNLLQDKQYNKGDARRDFDDLLGKTFLDSEELKNYEEEVKDNNKKYLGTIRLSDISKSILHESKELCKEIPESKVIERLASKPEISKWVEYGLEIHNIDDGKNNEQIQCEFCLNSLTPDRIKDLLKHFNEADQNLKRKLNNLLDRIDKWETDIRAIEKIEKDTLYSNYRDDYKNNFSVLSKKRDDLLNEIEKLKIVLRCKLEKRIETVNLDINLNADELFSELNSINSIIEKHNNIFKDSSKHMLEIKNSLINHYLSKIYDGVNKYRRDIDIYQFRRNKIEKESISLANKITEQKQALFKSKEACDEINQHIAWFFGRREIKLDVSESGDGYILKRGDKIAKRLSEGEKTAITLIHFVISLKDENYSLSRNDGIVVIDDPISSLDNDFLFAAFSFLVEHAFIYQQTFILTHNFYFLKMAIREFKNKYSGNENGDKEKVCYLMIKNKVNHLNKRCAFIDKLDPALEKFNTEYKYLFKILKEFMDNPDPDIEQSILIPNIARRFLESFIEFHDPAENNFWKTLKNNSLSKEEIKYVKNFLNKGSHIAELEIDSSFPVSVERVMNKLFKIIKKIYPEYFNEINIKNIPESPAESV